MQISQFFCWAACAWGLVTGSVLLAEERTPTKEFEVRNNRPWLGGHEVDLWGLRCGNALYSQAVTERHIHALDNMAAHGINLIGFYIQGSNGGVPNPEAGINGFTRDGAIKPFIADRMERLIREADKRGMVVMVGLCSPRKDQDFYDEAAIQNAMENTAKFLIDRQLKNVFVDLMHEFSHPERIDHPIFREPDGEAKKAKLTQWFKAVAPDIEVGICPDHDSTTGSRYPGMDIHIIQKDMEIPPDGFVVNVETFREDQYSYDGIFNPGAVQSVRDNCERYLAAPHAVMLFHAAYLQGISNQSGSAPHAEMGGYGTGVHDRGIRFYFDWVRDHKGRWEYPQHVPVK
ncbi:hypothetical protein [Planctomicrobium sp. SH664]|uniref:hypothetical protein n=1 Tax=Planctomicrobium sp. SH664 TaxID=3448125 RepID=UPI003F5B532E